MIIIPFNNLKVKQRNDLIFLTTQVSMYVLSLNSTRKRKKPYKKDSVLPQWNQQDLMCMETKQ